MKTAIITFSKQGYCVAKILSKQQKADIFVHKKVEVSTSNVFSRIRDILPFIWEEFSQLIFIAPSGLVIRSISSLLKSKYSDPAVVVIDIGTRWVISLLSGHEGGANKLAYDVANILGCVPIITTSSEARKNILVGMGCRKGIKLEILKEALFLALEQVGEPLAKVRHIASIELKKTEPGLLALGKEFNIPILFLPKFFFQQCKFDYTPSTFVKEKIGVFGVAEPACLMSGHCPKLILEKTTWKGVSVALAKESCMCLE
ncbi:cobalamin biosynthesis protein [Desulfonauticus submarinus]